MSIYQIRTIPDPVLRQKSNKVTGIDASVNKFIDSMIDTLQACESGVGLAANQVGKALRIAVIQIPDEEIMVLINPEIIERTGSRIVAEGCLSIPGYQAQITRSLSVKVKARNRQGKIIRIKGEDLLAQALEHEIDHLNGTLYIDYLEDQNQLISI